MAISLNDVQRGYDAWAAKPHNAKWVRKIDGTPIANDVVVNIFEAIKESRATAAEATVTALTEALAKAAEALEAAADQLARAHDDAFTQCAGYGLVTSDGRDFSCLELNKCGEQATRSPVQPFPRSGVRNEQGNNRGDGRRLDRTSFGCSARHQFRG